MNLAIIGSRTFNDYKLLKNEIDNFTKESFINITCIVSGGAKGADTLGEKYAREYNIPTKIFYPNWTLYGKKAGYLRNIDIIKNANYVIAFWDGVSTGTKSSIKLAKEQNKIIKIIYV